MLSKAMYAVEYIRKLQERTGKDPSLLERVIYAFGLLEAIRRSGMTFCFKGGTALMLLLESPRRLSTDIDIITEPDAEIDACIREAGKIFPFVDVEEKVRGGAPNIKKRHFKFKYRSPRTGRDVPVLLDVLFEKIQYEETVLRPIKNEFLLTEGEDLTVAIPNANSILGDKLTAFAPHTTGIPFGADKELEVIKQLFDCGTLFDAMTEYQQVKESYCRIVQSEIGYRGIDCSPAEVLEDTVRSCLCIASRGMSNEVDYRYFKDGINRIRNHIMGKNFSGEVAGAYASRVLYLAASLLTEQDTIKKIQDPTIYLGEEPRITKPKRFSYLRVVDPLAYAYLIEAMRLLKETELTE